MAEGKISELEGGAQEIIQSRERRLFNNWRNMSRVSETCGTRPKDLTFVLFESQESAKKEYGEIVAENLTKPAGNMSLQIEEVQQTSIGQTLKNLHQDTS